MAAATQRQTPLGRHQLSGFDQPRRRAAAANAHAREQIRRAADNGAGEPLHDAGIPRPRNAQAVAEGVADGVPRGTDSQRRRLHHLRDRQLLDHRRAHAAGISRAPQRVPASGPPPVRRRRTCLELHLPVPRFQLEPRRLVAFGDVGVGFPAHRQEELQFERGAVRHVGRLGVHQHGPQSRAAGEYSSAICRSISRCGNPRSVTSRRTSRR